MTLKGTQKQKAMKGVTKRTTTNRNKLTQKKKMNNSLPICKH